VVRREVLGAADVSDDRLADLVAAQLGVPEVELLASYAEDVAYDLPALTTAGRYWVRGTARHVGGDESFTFFVKHVQSWSRSPIFAMVPAELHEQALAMMPWEREPRVYASDLGERLPNGLELPRVYAVEPVDDLAATVWLEAVEVDSTPWDHAQYARAAYLLGRLAASERVAPLAELGAVPDVPRAYYVGRFQEQVLPALRDDGIWRHPVVAAAFDDRLRDDMRAAAEGLAGRLDELDDVPLATSHGDACCRNLLVRRDAGADTFVLIDFGFWGRAPVGFDLTQLLLGEVQMGERPASELPALEEVCLPAYVEGLHAEGLDVPIEVVRRSHALLMLLFSGLSALPFELLDGPPTDEKVRVARERAGLARFTLDLAGESATA
jgi:hypothetical protein